MKYKIIISIFLICLAGGFNGVMDRLDFRYGPPFPTLDGDQLVGLDRGFWDLHGDNERWLGSWVNKYNDYAAGDLRPKYIGATTFLVWTTDGWHLSKFLFNACWRTALILVCSVAWRFFKSPWLNTGVWILAWFVLAFIQAIGFTIIFK